MSAFRHARNCFLVAGVSSLVIKTACVAAMVPVYVSSVVDMQGQADVTFWLYALWPLVAALYLSQMYGCLILFRLARVAHRRHLLPSEAPLASAPDPVAPAASGSHRFRDLAQSALTRGATEVELDQKT